MSPIKKPIRQVNRLQLQAALLTAFLLGGISGYGIAIYLPEFSLQKVAILSHSIPTKHPTIADSKPIQVRFSPGGQCTAFVVQAIQSTQKTILVQAYSFTCPQIVGALIDAKKRGVAVKVLVDRSQLTARSSKVSQVLAAGIPIAIDQVPGIAHNKVMIIDDEYVLTGSFNWTAAAEKRNAENLLLIRDPDIHELYRENWEKRAMGAQLMHNP
ncbi:MAG: phospholipase D family protein [Burkholderiales bacterium]